MADRNQTPQGASAYSWTYQYQAQQRYVPYQQINPSWSNQVSPGYQQNYAGHLQQDQFQYQNNQRPRPQGEFHAHQQSQPNDVNIYSLVDSWKAYRNNSATFLAPRLNDQMASSAFNPSAASFQPAMSRTDQPYNQTSDVLRSVQSYARYPGYRIDKPYRSVNGGSQNAPIDASKPSRRPRRGKQISESFFTPNNSSLVSEAPQSSNSVSSFRSRCSLRSQTGHADQPLPSIEQNDYLPGKYISTEQNHHTTKQSIKANRKSRSQTPKTAPWHNSEVKRGPTKSPAAPSASLDYLIRAAQFPIRMPNPKKLLVILDLNGTLLYRGVNKSGGQRKVHMRPGVNNLLDYLFDNHVVMIYTSAMPASAADMLSQFLSPTHRSKLAAIWARDRLDLDPQQFKNKVQVYKKLDKIWNDTLIQSKAPRGTVWDQTNTVLIDDTQLKAKAQPHNLIQVSEYQTSDNPEHVKKLNKKSNLAKIQQDILKQLELKFEELKYQNDVSRMIRLWQNGELMPPELVDQEVVINETVDQKTLHASHLPTPDSIDHDIAYRTPLPESEDNDSDFGAPLSPVSSIDESVFQDLLGTRSSDS